MEEVRKGVAVRCGNFEIIPVEKWRQMDLKSGPFSFSCWAKEPLGIQVEVVGSAERYALDLEGRRSERLLEL